MTWIKIGRARIKRGDMLDVLKELPAGSVDTLLTDPPYGLSFMGRAWDHAVPGPLYWIAALRVLKPGAVALIFGGRGQHHRLMCALEDAGFELRDVGMWLFGQGNPKGLDISKAIDKANGDKRPVVGASPYASRRPNPMAGNTYDMNAAGWDPSANLNATGPGSFESAAWDGYNTNLKPAWEPIIIAQKPTAGTYANNARVHGVAGFDIDAARVMGAPGSGRWGGGRRPHGFGDTGAPGGDAAPNGAMNAAGRYPANVFLDPYTAGYLDGQAGKSTTSRGGTARSTAQAEDVNGMGRTPGGGAHAGGLRDTGGPARFFYVAKASRRERGPGNTHPTVKPVELIRYLCRLTQTPTGGVVLDPFMGSGTTALAAHLEGRAFIGVEQDPDYFQMARDRIERDTRQPSMF